MKDNNNFCAVPCGKCADCVARRQSAWSFRLMEEDKRSISSLFITLTYDTRFVPITQNGFMSLNRRDFQLFAKRLRKATQNDLVDLRPIRYYCVGEYGGRRCRPHFHVIMFNVPPKLIRPIGRDEKGHMKFKCDVIAKAWGNGGIDIGEVSRASVGYTLVYMTKTSRIPMHENDDRIPEFGLMSKGLGANYLTPAMVRWHKADLGERMYLNIEDGKKIAMPRYYKDKLYNSEERGFLKGVHERKRAEADAEAIRLGNVVTYDERREACIAANRKMHLNSKKLKSHEI